MARPREMEFSGKTKVEAMVRSGGKCEDCGWDGYVQIHHLLPIWYAVNLYPNIPHYLIASLANARVLCQDCHDSYHEDIKKEHPYYSAKLLEMV